MGERHRFAVLFALDVQSMSAPPSEERLQHVMDTGPNSVRQFWVDNVPYLDLEMTIFPRVTINPDRTPMDGGRPRTELIEAAAVAASEFRGLNRGDFDHLFVVVHGGNGFQFGASGKDAVVLTTTDFSTFCHEFGHCLGFDHSRGFYNQFGGGWSDDYGSRYDVMAIRGDLVLPQQDTLPPGPGWAGPMIARAVVHYDKPQALVQTGKVLELDLHDTPVAEQVWAAGRSGPGQPELLVFHTEGNRGDPKHRLMVEYRQPAPPGPSGWADGPSRWDGGLDASPTGDAPGVVVHTIKTARWPDGREAFDRPYYAGTVSLAAADYDVEVAFPWGSYTVALRAPGGVGRPAPDHVEVTVGRTPLGPAKVRVVAEYDAVRHPQRTERRRVPQLPAFLGPQEYVITSTDTTWRLSAHTLNVGGLSSLAQPEDSTLEWRVDGTSIPADSAAHTLHGGRFEASVAPTTRILTVRNTGPLPEIAVLTAEVQAWDAGAGAHLTTTRELTFEGETAEPGEALQRLLTWWDLKFRRRFPIPQPPTPLDMQQLRWAYRELERVDADLALLVKPFMAEEEAAWQRQLILNVGNRWRGPNR